MVPGTAPRVAVEWGAMSSFSRALAAALCLLGVACSSSDAADSDEPDGDDMYADVGRVPARAPIPSLPVTVPSGSSPGTESAETDPSTAATDSVPDGTEPDATKPRDSVPDDGEPVERGAVGESIDGNRVLVIGDSLIAATASRYSGTMCASLGRLGWTVEVEAETGQHIEFAQRVLDERLSDDWDVAVIMLGNNYEQDQAQFAAQLNDALDRLAPRPVMLFTVTEFDPTRIDVNAVIEYSAATRPNVLIVDWAAETSEPDSPWLSDDGLHLSDAGEKHLPDVLAYTLGPAPATPPGTCLRSVFSDDSDATLPDDN